MSQGKISTYRRNRIFACFCQDVTATAAAELVEVNRKTANCYYNEIREKILKETLRETPADDGEFEADESYFGARRVRGKRGRGRLASPRY
jgi:transposase